MQNGASLAPSGYPTTAGAGLSDEPRPRMGQATTLDTTGGARLSRTYKLWSQAGAAGDETTPVQRAMAASVDWRLSYGVGRGGGLMTPYHELTLSKQHPHQHRIGIDWQGPRLNLQISSDFARDRANQFLLHGKVEF